VVDWSKRPLTGRLIVDDEELAVFNRLETSQMRQVL
jgi:hypothetical protein